MGLLPDPIEEVLNAALVCELSVVNAESRPVTHPMIPLFDGEKIYMTSSALFSRKLDHIRANSKVAISISDLGAAHGDAMPRRVTVQGDARILEDDPHTTWERILPLWTAKEPIVQAFYEQRVALPLFWERALIELTPRKVLVWEGGDTSRAPEIVELEEASR
ncbi:MAG TPA: pyridoxamine 5'-phosphate oxidase family protein [Actinomycetota bacterium]|nr:pyridoxamine 5'-phosphate oxidase family protein [Actinomycetota bacterium]